MYIIISAKEGCVKENIERKEAASRKMRDAMIALTKQAVKEELNATCRVMAKYEPSVDMVLPKWAEMEVA